MSAAVQITESEAEVRAAMRAIGAQARAAARKLANAPAAKKSQALAAAARALRARSAEILAANARDLADAEAKSLSPALIDRLTLNPDRIEAIARGLEEVAALPDPVGRVIATFTRPNGLIIERVATPLGVVGVIYEAGRTSRRMRARSASRAATPSCCAAARTVFIVPPPSTRACSTA